MYRRLVAVLDISLILITFLTVLTSVRIILNFLYILNVCFEHVILIKNMLIFLISLKWRPLGKRCNFKREIVASKSRLLEKARVVRLRFDAVV